MKNFFNAIKSSFYNTHFYKEARTKSLKQAISIFVVLSATAIALPLIYGSSALVSFAYSHFLEDIKTAYPDDLIVTLKNGVMSINKPQPYYVKNSLPIFFNKETSEVTPKYLVVFDGTNKLSTDLEQNSTFVLMKDKFAITPGQNNQLQVVPFSTVATTTIVQKNLIVGMVDKVKPYFKPVVLGGGVLFFIIIVFFGSIFFTLLHLLYVLVPALLIFLGSMFHEKIPFKESYKIALYASIPVAIVFYILFSTVLKIQPPFVYTFAVIFVAYLNMFPIKSKTHIV